METGPGTRVRLEARGSVRTVRLHHPPLNAFDSAMRSDLGEVARDLADASDVGAVVLYGGERAFAAGADIHELADMGYEQIHHWNRAMQRTLDQFARLPMPVVAAIAGYALGGGLELALTADYRVADPGAQLGLPEVLLGIMPGSGGTQRLSRLVGPAKAKAIMMTGRRLDAAEAHAIGLVDQLSADGQVYEAALDYATRLAAGPRYAIQAIKQAVDHGTDASMAAGLALEHAAISGLFATADKDAGMQSFLADGPGHARFGD